MTAKRRTRRHVPLSRLRYEQENPTVSFRPPRSQKADLSDVLHVSEQSFADFVKEALGVKERSVGAAYDTGYRDAKEDYLVTYACTVCGQPWKLRATRRSLPLASSLESADGDTRTA